VADFGSLTIIEDLASHRANYIYLLIRASQKQHSGIGCNVAAIEPGDGFFTTNSRKIETQ
jgi:hypothetical protein